MEGAKGYVKCDISVIGRGDVVKVSSRDMAFICVGDETKEIHYNTEEAVWGPQYFPIAITLTKAHGTAVSVKAKGCIVA